jgi:aminoglycoside phosphotransferase
MNPDDNTTTSDDIDRASNALRNALEDLHHLMREACPGPHTIKQHRDNRPPWCRYCRRLSDGRHI